MSFNAATGLVYIPLIEMPMIYAYNPQEHYQPARSNQHVDTYDEPQDPRARPQSAQGVGPAQADYLQAWDPVAQQERWRIVVERPFKGAGVLSTAGRLVFQGTGRGYLNVYAADTGATLASINIGTSIMAAPISYAVDGEQYIAVMAGAGGAGYWTFPKESAAYRYGNEGRIVAFKLGGGPVPLPSKVDRNAPIPEPPPSTASKETIARGEELFDTSRCSWCHDQQGQPGLVPDLLALTREKHALFEQIVLGGALESKGIASFADVLSREDVQAIHAYLIDATKKRIESRKAGPAARAAISR